MKKQLVAEAAKNLEALRANSYPGCGIVVGLDDTGNLLVQVYWIMGGSENSVFDYDEKTGRLYTEAADPSKVKDPALIYNAMKEEQQSNEKVSVVSNGHQTDGVAKEFFYVDGGLYRTMRRNWGYEPDAPNFTPRITAVSYWSGLYKAPRAKMSILRKSPWNEECDQCHYDLDYLGQGFGHCITTYSGDGDPLPSFRGEPVLMPLNGDAWGIADTFWEALNPDNRVSLAVKMIPQYGPSHTFIINKLV